jgi:Tfp pilus assembly protein PilF
MQDMDEAESYLIRAYELNPKEPLISLYLGKFHIQKQEYVEAREYLVEAIAIDQ